jgi:hypothetical protein
MKFFIIGPGHHKNLESIHRMLDKRGIAWTQTSGTLDGLDDTFQVVLCLSHFFPPSSFPRSTKVIYGPHLFVMPEDPHLPIHYHEYEEGRFFFNTLSDWVAAVYCEFKHPGRPFMNMPLVQLPLGIDTHRLPAVRGGHRVVVYYKQSYPSRLNAVLKELEKRAIPHTVFHYGKYQEADYKAALAETRFVIWVGQHESQGFALQECLAMNVPILLWDVASMYEEITDGHRAVYADHRRFDRKLLATSAPYWSDECGLLIREENELPRAVDQMLLEADRFRPREYIDRVLSLDVCLDRFLDVLQIRSQPSQ